MPLADKVAPEELAAGSELAVGGERVAFLRPHTLQVVTSLHHYWGWGERKDPGRGWGEMG